MRILQCACVIGVVAIAYPFTQRELLPVPAARAPVEVPQAAVEAPQKDQARLKEAALEETDLHPADSSAVLPGSAADDEAPATPDLHYLTYYAYSEVPPDIKPADSIADAFKDIPIGTPTDEIQLATAALGLDFTFMETVAKIESDFNPFARTGSYYGIFQLSHYEFDKYGSGDITSPRDNAIAAAYKFTTAAILFEIVTHKKPTLYDLYLIHQQGTQGAAEHVSRPERIAWQSMCATDEGRQKGEKWCKRAIWQNTLPAIRQIWKSVDRLTSGAFVEMWQQRIDLFYSRYTQAIAGK
jgi:hypothetical protein